MKKILAVFLLLSNALFAGELLQGVIQLQLANGEPAIRALPGQSLSASLDVMNAGDKASLPGEIFVRFSCPAPLHTLQESCLFETEHLSLPILQPKEKTRLTFKAEYTLPTIYEFVLNDTGLRQYEAVAVRGGEETVIGRVPLTFSAHYYPGPVQVQELSGEDHPLTTLRPRDQ